MAANPVSRIHVAGAVCLLAGDCSAVNNSLSIVSWVGADGFTSPHAAPDVTGLQMVIALLRVGLTLGQKTGTGRTPTPAQPTDMPAR